MSTTTWVVHESEGVASGELIPVLAEGQLITVVQPIWSDADGVRVQWDVATLPDDLSVGQVHALSEALRDAAAVQPPQSCTG